MVTKKKEGKKKKGKEQSRLSQGRHPEKVMTATGGKWWVGDGHLTGCCTRD